MTGLRGRHFVCAGLVGLSLAAAAGGAHAREWQVRRTDSHDVVESAWRLMLAGPLDPAAAERSLRHLGVEQRENLLARARTAARAATARGQDVLAAGTLYLASGRRVEAVEILRRAVELAPTSSDAHALLARALLATDRPHDAVAAYEKALALLPRSRAAAAAKPMSRAGIVDGLVEAAFADHDPDKAVAVRRAEADAAPGEVAASEAVVDALIRAGRPGDAAELLGRLVDPGEGSPLAPSNHARPEARQRRLRAADLFARAGNHERAYGLRLAAVRDDPGLLTAGPVEGRRLLLAELEQSARLGRRLFELERWLRERLDATPGDALLTVALVRTREAIGDFVGALALVEPYLAHHPEDAAANALAVRLAQKTGDATKARDLGDARADRFSNDVGVVILSIEARLRQPAARGAAGPATVAPSSPPADHRFQAALRRFHGDADALAQLADAAASWDHDDWSLSAWQGVLRLRPDSTRALTAVGEIHFQHGRREIARRVWARLAHAIRPPARAEVELASIHAEHDDLDEAVRHARRAIVLDPNSIDGLRALADISERKKLWDRAAEAWKDILRRLPPAPATRPPNAAGPTDEYALVRREARGRLLALLTRQGPRELLAEALPLRERLSRGGLDVDSALYLSEIELQLRQMDRAVDTLRRTAVRYPDDRVVASELAALLRRRDPFPTALIGADRGAEDLLDGFVRRNPDNARWALGELAGLHAERGDWDKAYGFARRAAEAGVSDEPTWLRASEMAERASTSATNLPDAALDHAERARAVAHAPRAVIAHGRLLMRRGRVEAASTLLRSEATGARGPSASDLFAQDLLPSEIAGDLARLEWLVANRSDDGTPELRALHVDLLTRLVPDLYPRARTDAAAAAALARLSQLGLSPLLERVSRSSDFTAIALLGMLGRKEAIPALVGLLHPGTDGVRRGSGESRRTRDSRSVERSYLTESGLVALGRIGDPHVAAEIAGIVATGGSAVRLAGLWALGRLPATGDDPDRDSGHRNREAIAALLAQTVEDRNRSDESALACLALARRRAPGVTQTLVAALRDGSRDPQVRRAAALALALSVPDTSPHDPAIVAALVEALDSDATGLPLAGASTLAALGGEDGFAVLWRTVLAADPERAAIALRALAAFGRPAPDEDETLDLPIRVDRLLAARSLPASDPAEALDTIVEHARRARVVLDAALRDSGELRVRALRALHGLLAVRARAPGSAGASVSDEIVDDLLVPPLLAVLRAPGSGLSRWLALADLSLLRGPRVNTPELLAALSDLPESGLAFAELADIARTTALRSLGEGLDANTLIAGLRHLLWRGDPPERGPVRARWLALHLLSLPVLARSAAADLRRARSDPDPILRRDADRAMRAY